MGGACSSGLVPMSSPYSTPEVNSPLPLAPNRRKGTVTNSQQFRTLRRPLSQREAFDKVCDGTDANNNHAVPPDAGEGLFYEYTNANGEVIEPDGSIAIALWDFNGQRETDLSFKKGECITVIQRFSNGWWEGEVDGVIGDFPCNFVMIDEEEEEEEDDDEEICPLPPIQTRTVAPPAATVPAVGGNAPPPAVKGPPPGMNRQPSGPVTPPIPPKPVAPGAGVAPMASPVTPVSPVSHVSPATQPLQPAMVRPHVSPLDRPVSGKSLPIKEGFMTKKGHKRRNWKVRYFVLELGRLAYYKAPADFLARRRPKGEVVLNEGTNVRIAPEMRRSNCFSVSGGVGLLYITAPTGNEMADWMDKIGSAAGK